MTGSVLVVHCIDAEGPLVEKLDATFERLKERFGLDSLERTRDTIARLRRREVALGDAGLEKAVQDYLSPQRLDYVESLEDLTEMVGRVTSESLRAKFPDSSGAPYLFSWFILDFFGFRTNPRCRVEGLHTLWDWYHETLAGSPYPDGFYWHFHTVPVSGEGTLYNDCWTNNDCHEQVLAARILERDWFPSVFRAGACIENLDLSNWLELFIPFDFSNDWMPRRGFDRTRAVADWRDAPLDWRGYHPNHLDWRRPGAMRRRIFRSLEFSDGVNAVSKADIVGAFEAAALGQKAILGVYSHDRRDVEPEMERIHAIVTGCAENFPGIPWHWRNAHEAIREALGLVAIKSPSLSLALDGNTLTIRSSHPTFSTLPFVAVQNTDGRFYRDNPLIEVANREWIYKMRRSAEVRNVGAAVCYPDGSVATTKLPGPARRKS